MPNATVANDCIVSIRQLVIFGSRRGRDRAGSEKLSSLSSRLADCVRKGLVLSQLCLGQLSAVSRIACSRPMLHMLRMVVDRGVHPLKPMTHIPPFRPHSFPVSLLFPFTFFLLLPSPPHRSRPH